MNFATAEFMYQLRLPIFMFCFVLFGVLQMQFPQRKLPAYRPKIALTNLLLGVSGTVCIRLLVPISLLVLANARLDANFVGLLQWLNAIGILNTISWIIAGVILLDFAMYWQHRIMHTFQWLWRLHCIHHIDRAIEVTTAIRFHPIEILLSWGLKALLVITLGINPISIVLFEIILSSSALFNHSNIHIPKKWETWIRLLCVTPQMHHIHHSMSQCEHNSNFGFCLSFWDRLFGSYTNCAKHGDTNLAIGLANKPDRNFINLLIAPFRR